MILCKQILFSDDISRKNKNKYLYSFEVDTIVDEENTVISFLLGEFKKIKSTVLVVHI